MAITVLCLDVADVFSHFLMPPLWRHMAACPKQALCRLHLGKQFFLSWICIVYRFARLLSTQSYNYKPCHFDVQILKPSGSNYENGFVKGEMVNWDFVLGLAEILNSYYWHL